MSVRSCEQFQESGTALFWVHACRARLVHITTVSRGLVRAPVGHVPALPLTGSSLPLISLQPTSSQQAQAAILDRYAAATTAIVVLNEGWKDRQAAVGRLDSLSYHFRRVRVVELSA